MHDQQIYDIWKNIKPYKSFWRSYIDMILHPHKALILIKFAIQIMYTYDLKFGDREDGKESRY